MVNSQPSQPSILGQQPVPVMTPTQQYTGPQFAPAEQGLMPQPSAGWGSTVPAVPQSMPGQMLNHPYMPPPGTMPSQFGPGMMQLPSQSNLPPQTMVAPYCPDQIQ